MRDNRPRAIVVAPYSPAERGGAIALGAAAKQRAVLQGIASCGLKSLLVNSAHQNARSHRGRWRRLWIDEICIDEYEPRTLGARPLGKLLQAVVAPFLGYRLQKRARPKLIWLYNPYLFEALYAWGARLAAKDVTVVLELEDLPHARKRSGTGALKNSLDVLAYRFLLRRVDGLTVVQDWMRQLALRPEQRVWFLPVLLARVEHPPRAPHEGPLILGYFGGLTVEKGADILAEIVRRHPTHNWVICGAGELEGQFAELSRSHPATVRYYGAMPEAQFRQAFDTADIVVNLHRPIPEFGGGVFPYKLLEAVGAGKLVLSTPIEGCPSEVSSAIHWLRGDVASACVEALAQIEDLFGRSRQMRALAQEWVSKNFMARSVLRRILSDLWPVS